MVSSTFPLILVLLSLLPTFSACPPIKITDLLNSTRENTDFPIIILNFYDLKQEWMELVFQNFSRMRDFYSRSSDPKFISCKKAYFKFKLKYNYFN